MSASQTWSFNPWWVARAGRALDVVSAVETEGPTAVLGAQSVRFGRSENMFLLPSRGKAMRGKGVKKEQGKAEQSKECTCGCGAMEG